MSALSDGLLADEPPAAGPVGGPGNGVPNGGVLSGMTILPCRDLVIDATEHRALPQNPQNLTSQEVGISWPQW